MKKTTFERQGLAIRNQKKLQIPTENKPVRSCPEAHNCVRFEKLKMQKCMNQQITQGQRSACYQIDEIRLD
jgi:hypothetical protein